MGRAKAGRVKLLAVTTMWRVPLVPDSPKMNESGLPGYETVARFGRLAPTGTPPGMVNRVAVETARTAKRPERRATFETPGGEPVWQHACRVRRAGEARHREVAEGRHRRQHQGG